MHLSALTWNRYRSFKERQRVELAPITIIIGKNGSGKSVISRLPLLLASGIQGETHDPLDLVAGGIEHAAAYQDLINMRSALTFSLGAEISEEGRQYGFETTMRYVNETRSLAIEAFRISHGETDVVRADIADVAQLTKASPDYIVRAFGENLQPQPMAFSGLFPQLSYFHGVMRSQLSNIMELFRTALPQPSYLGPFRAEPGTLTRSPGQVVQTLGPRGERSIEMLADDKLRHNGSVGDAVRMRHRTTASFPGF